MAKQTRLVALAAALVGSAATMAQDDLGTLNLLIIDAATGAPTPARVEIRDQKGNFYVAQDALLFGGDCDMSDQGAGLTDLPSAYAAFTDRLRNPYSNAIQFYSEGSSSAQVPAGGATVTVFKGPEYEVASAQFVIPAGKAIDQRIVVKRWSDMPSKGWYSADDHVHIQRPDPELNPLILKMMQAEDIHVANLLQMGKVRNFEIAPQYAFGPDSHYQQGHYILATGQETPRTHFLGHTITLGASKPLFDPDKYLIYRLIWEQSVESGGINGFAHAFLANGNVSPYDGMAVVLPHDLLHFVEVLQFNRSGYDAWYDILNLGFRVTPTAGTDYPCADQTIVGHERFYTRVDGELSYEKWVEAVREGRTFVTTGPMAEFTINGQDIGGDVLLEVPAVVRIEGSVSFNPARDALEVVEVLRNGNIIARFSPIDGQTTIAFELEERVEQSSWFALRGYGAEYNASGGVSPLHFGSFQPTSNVHTAPVYVSLKDEKATTNYPSSRAVAREWLARLYNLERVLDETNLEELGRSLEVPNFDAVPAETLRQNRAALLLEIEQAKEYFEMMAGH